MCNFALERRKKRSFVYLSSLSSIYLCRQIITNLKHTTMNFFDLFKKKPEPIILADGKAHIYNLIILEESGSMLHLADATISGLQETIGTIRQAQQEFGDKREMSGDWDSIQKMSVQEKKMRMAERARMYYQGRVTPERVETLQPNEVFVFFSDPNGLHMNTTARYAVKHVGAIIGQGAGMQCQCYAIPISNSMPFILRNIQDFIQYATQHPEKKFVVTPISCELGQYSPELIAPMFEDCIHLENVSLPTEFWKVMGINMMKV